MSEIGALEKLRTAARNMAKGRNLENYEECNLLLIIADEIEAEIAERYMLLPCDADGAPIHVGDVMEYENPNDEDKPFTVIGVNNDGDVFHCLEDKRLVPTCISLANCLRHHSPRTVEDVLRDVWKEALDYAKSDMWRNPDEVFVERAEEIRAMFGEVD